MKRFLCMAAFAIVISGTGEAQTLTREQTARRLYNEALTTKSVERFEELLNRIISEFPETAVATEAIKSRKEHEEAIRLENERRKRLVESLEVTEREAVAAKARARSEALGGFTISDITVHGLRVPIPNKSTYRREGTDPEIVKLEIPGGNSAIHQFFLTAMPEFGWKPIGLGSRCWLHPNPTTEHDERLCLDVENLKTSMYVTSLK